MILFSSAIILSCNHFHNAFLLDKFECPKENTYCDGPRIRRNGDRVDNWRDCGLLCHKTDRCNHWHFYEANKACLMYENCTFKKGKGNVAGSVGCPGGDKNIIAG